MNMLSAVRQDRSLLHLSRKLSLLPSVRKLEEPKLQLARPWDGTEGPPTAGNAGAASASKLNDLSAQRHRACPQQARRGVSGVSNFYCTEGEINNLKAEMLRGERKWKAVISPSFQHQNWFMVLGLASTQSPSSHLPGSLPGLLPAGRTALSQVFFPEEQKRWRQGRPCKTPPHPTATARQP